MNLKGSLPLLILVTLEDTPKHGYQIAKQIKEQSGGVLDFKEGTLYPALHSLEKQGLIAAYTEQVNGRERRYYRLTDAGRAWMNAERSEWSRYTEAVNLILRGSES